MAIKIVLREWDPSLTDAIVAKFENIKLKRADAEASAVRSKVGSAKSRVETASENHRLEQKRLKESRVELERVITVIRGGGIVFKNTLGRAYHLAP